MEKEKLYLFNPFKIQQASEEEIAATYQNLYDELIEDPDTPYHISKNIEIYSNLCYLCGEIIARVTELHDKIKNDKDIREAQAVYMFRNEWTATKEEKPPAISYFESKAKQTVMKEYSELAELNSKLIRFKKCYESLENKSNALKKRLEAIKYETM